MNAIYEAQQNALEGAMLSAVMRVGIDVNKEELIKALAYDRQQYEKGYADAKAEIVRCKDCKHFHYDMPYVIQGIPVLGHEVCDFWGDGCKTSENGFCSYAERRTDAE